MYPRLRDAKSRLLSLDRGGCGLQQWRQVLNVQKVRVDGKWNKDAYAGSHCLWDEVHVELDVL